MSKLWNWLGGVKALEDAWFLGVTHQIRGFPVRGFARAISNKGWLLFLGLFVYGIAVRWIFTNEAALRLDVLGTVVFILIAFSKTYWVTAEEAKELSRLGKI
jgi:hypothetical protein